MKRANAIIIFAIVLLLVSMGLFLSIRMGGTQQQLFLVATVATALLAFSAVALYTKVYGGEDSPRYPGPSGGPTPHPSGGPTPHPSGGPTPHPSGGPTPHPSGGPTPHPSGGPTPHPAGGPTPHPSGGPRVPQLTVSSDSLKGAVTNNVFSPIKIFNDAHIPPSTGLLMNYVSSEFDPWQFQDTNENFDSPVLRGITDWFTNTLNECVSGDILMINCDFISMDSQTQSLIKTKLDAGMIFILIVDRWEVSGYPVLASQEGKSWSPNQNTNDGCLAASGHSCKEDATVADKYPYGCAANTPGYGNSYCNTTNSPIWAFKDSDTFFLLDQASTKVDLPTGSSRAAPLHNHRHLTTFYLPSKGLVSTFKGSWNFTGGSPGAHLTEGQKESGFTLTGAMTSDPIQMDLIANYCWLAGMALFSPASMAPPEKFTAPGHTASPLFAKLLALVNPSLKDTSKDQLLFPDYGRTYELYSITQKSSTTTYISGDPAAVITMGYGPPPAPRRGVTGLANPTPWDSSNPMSTRTITDGGVPYTFNKAWPTLSCVSNTLQFLYPYTPVFKTNPAPPLAWRVPSASAMPQNCGAASVEYFDNTKIGQSCTTNTDCGGDDGNCLSGYCAFPGDINCPPGGDSGHCQRCKRVDPGQTKDGFCGTDPSAMPHCYSGQAPTCQLHAGSSDNYDCKDGSDGCPCYLCQVSKTCPALTNGDVGAACFVTNTDHQLIPSNNCYKDGGKNYDCAARMPWIPGGIWLGGLMYKFFKDAQAEGNKSIYVSMYSSFDDTAQVCLFNAPCNNYLVGGDSPWATGQTTTPQYSVNINRKAANAIDGGGAWHSAGDPNFVQDVLDFLKVSGTSLSLIRGQWAALGGHAVLDKFRHAATTNHSTYNMKMYLAQKKQVTQNGGGDTVTTAMDDGHNPAKHRANRRNHTKCYISMDSIMSCSGHPYNGGTQDWSGVNEAMLVEHCPNACKPVRLNWEKEYSYAETPIHASTFPWFQDVGAHMTVDPNVGPTSVSSISWNSGSHVGGLVSIS